MDIIYHPIFLDHDTGMHPENRKRLEAFGKLPIANIPSGETYLTLYHTQAYVDHVKVACEHSEHLDPDTITSPRTYDAAITAVGAAILASQTHGFALVRPPGHHAHPDHSSGFCIFNNIGIAVQKLVNEGKRVLIVDFDSHPGDGTASFFYKTNKVMYVTFHQDTAFPGGGDTANIGEEDGAGFTINVPLPKGTGDDIIIGALKRLLPILQQFKPDHVGVSAGFDGHQQDLLLGLRYSLNAYYQIGSILSSTFPNIFATLEGGYNIELLPKCVGNFITGINNTQQQYIEEKTDSAIVALEAYEIIMQKLKNSLSKYWDTKSI